MLLLPLHHRRIKLHEDGRLGPGLVLDADVVRRHPACSRVEVVCCVRPHTRLIFETQEVPGAGQPGGGARSP